MNKEEAMQHGLGYATGREDASGTRTAASPAEPHLSGFYAFAAAYAQGWDDYNDQRRHMMVACRDAYDTWQESGGRTVFRRGELTLSESQRAELLRHRPGAFAAPGEFTAYWAMRDQMQADAWDALHVPAGNETR